jgi:succinoglycan biosynthesis transport protein ExoP
LDCRRVASALKNIFINNTLFTFRHHNQNDESTDEPLDVEAARAKVGVTAPLERSKGMDQQGQQVVAREDAGASGFEHAGRAVYRRIRAIAALPILFGLSTAAIVLPLPDRYEASAVIQIDPRQKSAAEAASDGLESNAEQHTIESEIETLRSAHIVNRVVDELGLGADPEFAIRWPKAQINKLLRLPSPTRAAEVSDRLVVSRIRNTLLLDVRFSANDPAKAARIANTIVDAYLKDQADDKWRPATSTAPATVGGPSTEASGAGARLTASERVFETLVAQYGQSLQVPSARIVKIAEPPRAAAAPQRKSLIALAAASGLIIATAMALLLELSAPGSADTHNVQKAFACPYMTSVPATFSDDAGQLPTTRAARLVLAEPTGQYAEAIRNAGHELDRCRGGAPALVVLVVSALPGEGSELFASNLAHHLAVGGGSPLLVDADLRMKGLTRQLVGHSGRGLLDQIASHQPVEEAILRDGVTGLHFLPASGPAPIPLSVPSALRSPALADAIAMLRGHFATIILSAPPLLPVSDARVLAELADQIVFVTAWHKTPRPLARKALTSLGANQRKVVGAVLTDVADEAGVSIMSFAEIFNEIRRSAWFADRAA